MKSKITKVNKTAHSASARKFTDDEKIVIWTLSAYKYLLTRVSEWCYENIGYPEIEIVPFADFDLLEDAIKQATEESSGSENGLPDLVYLRDCDAMQLKQSYPVAFACLNDHISDGFVPCATMPDEEDWIYFYPCINNQVALYYRQDVFDMLGISMPENLNYDEFQEICRIIYEGWRDGSSNKYPLFFDESYLKIFMRARGTELVSELYSGVPEWLRELFEYFNYFYEQGFLPTEWATSNLNQMLSDGCIAMVIGDTSVYSRIKNSISNYTDVQWNVAGIPKNEPLIYEVSMGVSGFFVCDHGEENTEQVMGFLKDIFNPDYKLLDELVKDFNIVPACKSVFPFLPSDAVDGFTCNPIERLADLSLDTQYIPSFYELEKDEALKNMLMVYDDYLARVIFGDITVDEAMSELERIYDDIMPPNGEFPPPEIMTLERIEIFQSPLKTVYYNGEDFDPAGMIVKAHFINEDTQKVITLKVTNFVYMPTTLLIGDSRVTIMYTYNGVTCEAYQEIRVVHLIATGIQAQSLRQVYYENEPIYSSDMAVYVRYENGKSERIYNFGYEPKKATLGINKITVTYIDGQKFTADVPITVYPNPFTIKIETLPANMQYAPGDRFNPAGMIVKAYYASGKEKIISNGLLNISNKQLKFENDALTEVVTISYTENGKTSIAELTVNRRSGAGFNECETTQKLGADTGTINLYSGRIRFVHNDFEVGTSTVPIGISHIYDGIHSNKYGVGKGWRLNLNQEIISVENGTAWEYMDKKGEYIHLSGGFDGSRSDITQPGQIRNESRGLQLYFYAVNKCALVDSSNNALVFDKLGDRYILSEIHAYPSTPIDPNAVYMLTITHNSLGYITSVSGGKLPSGSIPSVNFYYINNLLYKLEYTGEKTDVPVTYDYDEKSPDSLIGINNYGYISSDKKSSTETKFAYTETTFTVTDMSSRDEAGNGKSLKYEFDNDNRVSSYSVGYGDEADTYAIGYTEQKTRAVNSIGVRRSTYITHDDIISVSSFNEYGTASRYSYIKSENSGTPYKTLLDATANGFDYKAFADKYSDTLDEYCESLEDATSVTKIITLDSVLINAFGATVYLSLWVKSDEASQIRIVVDGDSKNAIVYNVDDELKSVWQYAAFPLKIQPSQLVAFKHYILISLNAESVFDLRVTKAPYTIPSDIPNKKYDLYGNILYDYGYDPISRKTVTIFNTYNTDRQIISTLEYVGTTLNNKIEYEYTNGLLTEVRNYGAEKTYYLSQKQTYSNGFVTQTEDDNGVITNYSYGTDYSQATVIGSANSPNITRKDTYINNTETLIETSLGDTQNALYYNNRGYLNNVEYNYTCDEFDMCNYASNIDFEYDTFGNVNAVYIGNTELYSAVYDSRHLNSVTYANGYTVDYTYDTYDRVTQISDNNGTVASIAYADNGGTTVTDTCGVTYKSEVVNTNGITSIYEIKHDGNSRTVKIEGRALNGTGNISTTNYYVGDADPFEVQKVKTNIYGLPVEISRNHGGTTSFTYAYANLLSEKTTSYSGGSSYKTSYTHGSSGNIVKSRIDQERFAINGTTAETFNYKYYPNGNIQEIMDGTGKILVMYTYDKYNRLIEEYNEPRGTQTTYKYDNGGNITEVTTALLNSASAPTTRRYEYNNTNTALGQNSAWHDQLKSYDGKIIKYDASGNPLNWIGGKNLTWRGRRLTELDGIEIKYDYSGQRTRKGDILYFYQGTKLLAEQNIGIKPRFIYYYYDESGVCGMNLNGTDYYYRKNIFGDIVGVYNTSGSMLCKYIYDARGNHRVVDEQGKAITDINHIGNLNPFRYRGYYYDTEFGLYYLNSRYYDPIVCRFISPDAVDYLNPEMVGGMNLYAYCNNNPVMRVDPNGGFALGIFFAIVAIALFTNVGSIAAQTVVSAVSYIGMAIFSLWDEQIRTDMNSIGWNPFNSSEKAVLDSNKVSFYKGVPVIRADGNRSGTFLFMVLTYETSKRTNAIDEVRHEWGHVVQSMLMGPANYLLTVGVMSPLKLRSDKWGGYYNSPWETMADVFGGVQSRTHSSEQISQALLYTSSGALLFLAAYLFLI